MCGIVGMIGNSPVNQDIYDALLLLQHRGQDSTGMATAEASGHLHLFRARGQVREVVRTRDMRALPGAVGLGHVRYATRGAASSEEEQQPFYVNSPYGITLVHNGNLTNTRELTDELRNRDRRHVNSSSDTELLLNVLASELQDTTGPTDLTTDGIFNAVAATHHRIDGAYAVVAIIAHHGLLAFRDPFGIRPLVLGRRRPTPQQLEEHPDAHDEWVVASESLVLENGNYELVREVAPGEAVFITADGKLYSRQCAEHPVLEPCSFEYVYLARPDSVMNGISVYDSRLRMGARLARTIAEHMPVEDVDVVMPIPDSARPAAMEVARVLDIEYREGFFKNRYVGRTFIMPGQAVRKKSVRQKLNAMSTEFSGKHVLLVDDSIVRGTTSSQIIEMARAAGARKVTFASAAPPIRYPHVYGINIPTESELIAAGRTIPEICELLGADHLIYQEVEDLEAAILDGQTDQKLDGLDLSCFTGEYVTGTVTQEYLDWVAGAQES
ncbi:MAG: amidophosphoribosyltransferase [Corynebacterium provencense]|jgi:amidophosphoribosyltransferase|uniref:amidophosphoribosyltransferase n=1 Tax=Corynebacterium provencense TaxID=1737425 RepID=UPI00298A030F|nr:amidophosphoribosyltransferase [Corynebacterium provencense]